MRQVLEREQVKIGKICARKRKERTLSKRNLRKMAKKEPGVGTLVGKGRITGPDSVKLGKMLRARGLG